MENILQVSVIMSVHNEERYLDESIESILNQTLKDFEFIIIDDGSSDNSLKIIKRFLKGDQRIRLIQNKENIGLTKSLIKGIKDAKGRYIARQDADDISLHERLRKQFNFLEKNKNIFLLGTNAIYIDEGGEDFYQSHVPLNHIQIQKKLKKGNCLIHCSVMFRNKNVLYREKFKYAQDYDLYLNILTMGYKIANLNETLIKSRLNPEAITFNKNYQQGFFAHKARYFYIQRLKEGKDDYDIFRPKEITDNTGINKEKIYLKRRMDILLKSGRFKEAKRCFREYRKTSRVCEIRLLFYVICIHMPWAYRMYRKIFYHEKNG